MISFLYKFVDILKLMFKNSKNTKINTKKNLKCCFNCKNKLESKDIVYFAFDKRFCSEECREYYIL